MAEKHIEPEWINRLLLETKAIVPVDDGDMQLSLIALALAVACKSCDVDDADAVRMFSETLNQVRPDHLIPFSEVMS